MKHLCFLVNPTNHWQVAIDHTRALCHNAIKQGHHISAVFFYGQAAYIAADCEQQKKWSQLTIENLFICRTMLENYRIDTALADNTFKIIGMAPWVLLLEQSDRIIEVV